VLSGKEKEERDGAISKLACTFKFSKNFAPLRLCVKNSSLHEFTWGFFSESRAAGLIIII
jgi:hypothetical protein